MPFGTSAPGADDRAHLGAVVARVRTHLRRRAALAVVLWAAAAFGAALAAAWLLAGADGWGHGSPGPLLLDLALVALAVALAGWLLRGERSWLKEERIARAMEVPAGLAAGAVEGALQLARRLPPGVSASLASAAQRSVAGRLGLPPERLAGTLGARTAGWIRRGGAALALLAPVVMLLAVATPDRSLEAWSGLGRPLRTLSRTALPALGVSPGDAEVLRGAPVMVTVQAPGRAEVTLRWQAEGDVAHSETLVAEDGEVRFRFEEVSAAIEYAAAAPDGAASPTFRLLPIDPLLVSDVELELAFPPHTGRAPESYEGDVPPLVVPAGTRIRVRGRATSPLAEAALEREEDGLRVLLEADGTGFVGGWTPRGSGRYAWRFRDAQGLAAELVPAALDLTVVADSAPSIRVAFPEGDTVLPLTLQQPLVIELRDDYGVGALELVAYRVTSGGERLPAVVQRTELGGTRAALARPVMDLSDWGLMPGDTVRYFARALDNAPDPSSAQTREYVLRVPVVAELRRGAQQELEEIADRLQELAERARRASEDSQDLEREARARAQQSAGPDPRAQAGRRPDPSLAGFEQREQLRQALERQQAMTDEARQARDELEAIAEALREAGASDPEFQSDLLELQELLQEIASPELRERLEQMAAALDQTDAREARRTIEELAREQERFREQLENLLEQLRRAAVEQDFRAMVADVRELGQREQALADALREGGDPELRKEQQTELRDQAQELLEQLDELEQRLAVLEEEAARAGVEEAGREAVQGQQSMEQALRALAEQTRAGERSTQTQRPNPEAAERARAAAEAMQEAAGRLEQARRQMSTERQAALQQLLVQVSQEALSLARRQAELGREMQSARNEQIADLRGAEAALLQGLRSMAENIAVQAQGQASQVRDAVTGIGMAMGAVERTVQALEARRGTVPSPENSAEEAVAALNRLAIATMMAGQPSGEWSDPGQGDVQQRLEQLAQQQGELNNRASQILPMQLGQQAMAQQAQQLARGQEEVAGELENLSQQPGAEGETLGSLEALAEEARQLAEALAGGRLDAESRARQERLFHRLLDAGRTLENDDVSDERQSRTATAFERGDVLPLGPEALGMLRFGLPPAEQLQRLSPAERELVLRYFDRLNRAAPPAASPEMGAPR